MAADAIANYRDIRFDEQGRPYLTTVSGQRSYMAPIQAAQSGNPRAVQWAADHGFVITRDASGAATGVQDAAVPNATFAHSRGEWNPTTGQYEQSLNQGGLMGLVEGASAVAAPFALGALMPTAASAGAGAAAGENAALGAHAGLTAGGAAAGVAGTAAGMAAGAGANGLVHGLTSNIGPLAGLITSLSGAGAGGGGGSNQDQLARLQAITEARMRRVDPLHQMVTQLAASRLPINVQRPIPDVPLP